MWPQGWGSHCQQTPLPTEPPHRPFISYLMQGNVDTDWLQAVGGWAGL
ncbi:hypothetical protein LEMLEM_LOCUS22041 [Lemmus lemmus]